MKYSIFSDDKEVSAICIVSYEQLLFPVQAFIIKQEARVSPSKSTPGCTVGHKILFGRQRPRFLRSSASCTASASDWSCPLLAMEEVKTRTSHRGPARSPQPLPCRTGSHPALCPHLHSLHARLNAPALRILPVGPCSAASLPRVVIGRLSPSSRHRVIVGIAGVVVLVKGREPRAGELVWEVAVAEAALRAREG